MSGSEKGSACAQCDSPVSDTLAAEFLDDELTVDTDLPCVGCEYNLRTLYAGNVCPECGLPLIESLSPDQVLTNSRKWLARCYDGMSALLVAAVGIPAAWAIQGMVFVAGSNNPVSTSVAFISGLAAILFCLVGLAGVFWVITEGEPPPRRPAGHDRPRTALWIILGCLALEIVGVVVISLASPGVIHLLSVIIHLPVMLVLAACSLSPPLHLRWFARLAGRERLARACTWLFWAALIAALSLYAAMLLSLLTISFKLLNPPSHIRLYRSLAVILSILGLLSGITAHFMTIYILYHLRRRFKELVAFRRKMEGADNPTAA